MYLLIAIVSILNMKLTISTSTTETVTQPSEEKQARTIRLNYDPLVTSYDEKIHYFPHYGYEPYWTDGQYLIKHPDTDLKPGETTTKMPLVCGDECGYLYLRIRVLCAGNLATQHIWLTPSAQSYYDFDNITNFEKNYRTFGSYCEFLDTNCKLQPLERWNILHLGKCRTREEYHYPAWPASFIVNRVTTWLEESQQRIIDTISKS